MLWFCYVFMLAMIILTKVWNHKIEANLSWKTVWYKFFFGVEDDGITKYYTWTILAAELVLGAWYVGDLSSLGFPNNTIPQHWTVALFIGTVAELVAPYFIKKAIDGISAGASAMFGKKGE